MTQISGQSRPIATAARVLLKARPTPRQLSDRLRPPLPEGLEIYLDAADIASDRCVDDIAHQLARFDLPSGFALLVEGPVRSLDGSFFDLTEPSVANRLVVERLAAVGQALGARAACVHLIAPRHDLAGVSPAEGLEMVDACLPLTRHYVSVCQDAGLTPTVENVPPVARMRESRYMTSPIGGPPEHLIRLGDQVPGLRVTVDTSHAALFLNAANGVDDGDASFQRLTASMAASSSTRDLGTYLRRLSGRIESAHVSDARGLLGEGLPYGEGDADLDSAVDTLLGEAHWIVAEILEPDPDHSELMRTSADRMIARRAVGGIGR